MAKVEIEDTELAELRKQATAGVKQTALAEALAGELKTAKEAASRVPTLEADLAQHRAAQVESTFTGAGIADAKVRKVFQIEFDEQAATATGEKDLGKWIAGLQGMKPEERPAHLAPFIKAPVAGAGNDANRTVLPNANKGAQPPAAVAGAYTPEQIAGMSDEEFRGAFASLAKQNPALEALSGLVNPTKTN